MDKFVPGSGIDRFLDHIEKSFFTLNVFSCKFETEFLPSAFQGFRVKDCACNFIIVVVIS